MLEGSSRSAKTWSGIDFIVMLCSRYDKDCTIFIIRETYQSFKTTLYDDFKRRLTMLGIAHPFNDAKDVHSFKILGSTIHFIGADKPSKIHGAGCDYFFINEGMHIDKPIFDQLEMRCRKFWWIDYNPSATEHWIFRSILKREDVAYLHSTWRDNPFISKEEKGKILSYEPT